MGLECVFVDCNTRQVEQSCGSSVNGDDEDVR
jgi:hypothetical protein